VKQELVENSFGFCTPFAVWLPHYFCQKLFSHISPFSIALSLDETFALQLSFNFMFSRALDKFSFLKCVRSCSFRALFFVLTTSMAEEGLETTGQGCELLISMGKKQKGKNEQVTILLPS
jgi:hypothetical protein